MKRSSENNVMKFYIVLVKYILFKFINNFYLIELGFLYRDIIDKNVFFFYDIKLVNWKILIIKCIIVKLKKNDI